ncbi:Glutathione S-transferase T1 [Euphorbia peplus]|nr:Glutathione S-transferase T1 [Euphorbia peplus]
MKLKVYGDRLSQPARTVILFCKVNGIDFEEIRIELVKRQHLTPEFKEINPLGEMPAIVDGKFKLSESHAILIYLASVNPGVADHWYPADVYKKAKIQSVLDWHHRNSRTAALYLFNTVLAAQYDLPLDPQAAAEAQKILCSSLSKIESIWLTGSGPFLLGEKQPSVADLSLVCELMQLELVAEEDRNRILGPYKKVQQWIEDTKNATRPHFDEVHKLLFKFKVKLEKRRQAGSRSETQSSLKTTMPSKM